jgi:hypothetical protein
MMPSGILKLQKIEIFSYPIQNDMHHNTVATEHEVYQQPAGLPV